MTRAPRKQPCCENCSKRPSFANPSEKRPRWCSEHRPAGACAVHVTSKTCKHPGCTKQANFGTVKPPQWCSEHRPAGAVNLSSKKCKHPGCTKIPSFGSTTREWCNEHRPAGTVDLVSKKCKHPDCSKQANFGTSRTPQWCSEHRPAGAVDVTSKKCKHPSCSKRATFGTDKTPQWCSEHHPTGAVDVVSKKCKHPGCTTRPYFGITKPEWCSEHRPAGAVNITGKKCKHPGCTKNPTFGSTTREWCSEHRPDCAVDLMNKKCEANGCTIRATYDILGSKCPRWCRQHMTDDAIDVVSKRCAHEDCDIFVSRKMWCATHDVEAVHQRRQRVRENQVAAFLSNSGFQWSKWNKQLGEPACGRYRPDFVYSLDTHVVIVEVDEDQHSTYDQSCERKRMLDIFSSFGGTPVTFLRYNPDIFQIGGATVRRTKQIRLQTLARRLQAALNTVPTNVLTIEYLFYNGADVSTYHVSPDDPSFVLHPVNSK